MAHPEQVTENRLTSERLAVFQDALETLYIRRNVSGRLKFTEEWPDAAAYIFGQELMQVDIQGTQDKERRAVLEEEAEDRRVELLETVVALELMSAERGVLQVEYVQGVIARYGRRLSLVLYADKIVNRFAPPQADEIPPAAPAPRPKIQEIPEPEIPVENIPMPQQMHVPEPVFEDEQEKKAPAPRPEDLIKPISTDAPAAPVSLDPPQQRQPAPPPLAEDAAAPKKRGTLKIFGIKDSKDS